MSDRSQISPAYIAAIAQEVQPVVNGGDRSIGTAAP
jgi:hypothetical protein